MTAYQAAPSAELAAILAHNLLKQSDTDGVLGLWDKLAKPVDASAREGLLQVCADHQQPQLAEPLFDTDDPAQRMALARFYLEQGLKGKAAEHYRQARAQAPDLQEAALDRLLDEAERPRLKVVEKPPAANVQNLFEHREPVTTFADVVGLDAIKRQIHKKIILPFQKPSLFQRFRKKVGGGVLLYGPPGCGKTLLARATAGECNAAFYNIEASDVLDMYIGESESKLHAIFEKARQETPCVLFFDELEALAGKREFSRNQSGNNLVSQFLSEMDGFAQANTGVLVLAATNVPWAVDAAFLRPGRFDRMFFVPPPDRPAREAILSHHLEGRPASNDTGLTELAKRTGGYSGADLANLVEMAADEAIEATLESGEEVQISRQHFLDALGDSRPTTQEWLTTARNYARYANDGGRYNDVLDFLSKHGKK